MRRTAFVVILSLRTLLLIPHLEAQTPQTYTLSAEVTSDNLKIPLTIYRDGPRERIEVTMGSSPIITLFDFPARKVYWLGWSGPQSCSSGHYLSARAPIEQDPITGSADNLVKLAAGRRRRVVRAEPVNGIPARLEEFVGPAPRPSADSLPPSRVWLAEPGGFVLKLEATGKDGRPVAQFEVKRFSPGKPAAALLAPPANCTATDATLDDSGLMRAHAESKVDVKAEGTANLDTNTVHGSATATSSSGKPASGSTARITAVTLKAEEVPYDGPCGRKLQVTGDITADGPATLWYRFYANVSGVDFSGGQNGTIDLESAGEASLVKDATFPISKRGELRLQAAVQGPDGRHGSVTISNVVPFQVTCAGQRPGR